MKKLVIGCVLLFFLVIGLIAISDCLSGSNSPDLSSDKYVAIYEECNNSGTVIEGNGTVILIPVPCPVPMNFDYDGSKGYSG
jgi:hypothetical protein